VCARVLRRAAVIFTLGLLLRAALLPLATLRIPGVLSASRSAASWPPCSCWPPVAPPGWRVQAVAAGLLLVGYWVVMTQVAAPGRVAGDLGPAGNLAGYVDQVVLGPRHIWQATRVYDPEAS
jgi:predicted acyltransferase